MPSTRISWSAATPRVLSEWEPGATLHTFLEQQLSDSTSPLVVVGERIVTAEFPAARQAGSVLRAIGAGALPGPFRRGARYDTRQLADVPGP
ncbi:hypothetical protein BH23ACT10_BH23ACT10_40450 [soil metagenome]